MDISIRCDIYTNSGLLRYFHYTFVASKIRCSCHIYSSMYITFLNIFAELQFECSEFHQARFFRYEALKMRNLLQKYFSLNILFATPEPDWRYEA